MSVTAEEVRRKIENARNAGDDRAVEALEGYLQSLETPAPAPAEGVAAQQAGALPEPDAPDQPEAEVPALQQGLSDEERRNSIYLNQYNRDQEIARQQYENPGEVDWASRAQFLGDPSAWDELKTGSQQAIQDPETGEWRWSALSPEQIEEIENPSGLTGRAALGALQAGVVRQVGQRVESIDQGIETRRNIQSLLWEQLPQAEQQRIRESIAEDAGVDISRVTPEALSTLSAYQFKKYLDQNPDNEAILANMMGDEEAIVRGERWRRIGNRISAVVPRMPVNVFGAQETMGGVLGQGAYEDIEYGEEQRAPIYPGASKDIGDWLSQASHDSDATLGGIYERVFRPMFTTEEGRLPGESVSAAADFIREATRSERQQEAAEKPFFPEDMTWRDALDSEFWTDPDTKLPWNDFTGFSLTFLETTPQIAEGIVAARMGGRVGASQAAKHYAGSTLQRIEQARRRWAMTGGVLTGGTAEGLMIRDEVASDVRSTLQDVPIEKFREDEIFQAMVAAGMTEEEARQVLIDDSARVAGDTGFWVAGVAAGSPMSAFFGRVGAGRVGGRTTAGQVATGMLGEGFQEGSQEVIEGEISDWQIRDVDPDNPIFSNPNRRLERFGGGFFTGGPIGALGAVESQDPAGLGEENKPAMEAAQRYMEATNERVKFERNLPPPQESVADPIARLQQLEKLEQLQRAEAEALLEGYDLMKEYFEENPSQTSSVELKMLNALRLRANSTLTDIEVARSRRQTAQEMVEEQEQILKERADIQRQVTEDMMTLEDIDRQLTNIESVQNNEVVDEAAYEEMLKSGYGRWSNKNKDRFVLTPKGKRATNLLNQQRAHMTRKLEAGYTGRDRRQTENLARREMIEQAGPAEREQMLYTDTLTGVQNRRAFNERVQNEEGTKRAVAAVDVDGLAWVNDNMGHAAGDRLLVAVADAIGNQKGVEIFRLGGDEFAVTGASEQQLENALQAAARSLRDEPIADNEQEVTPQITWGKGNTYEDADLQAATMKRDRVQRRVIADRKAKPTTWRARAQMGLFQLDDSGAIQRGEDAAELPNRWSQIRDEVRRRDFVELLTPTGAVPGIVTSVNRSRSRPRIEVTSMGRKFRFNPERNHLITHNTDPADIAWLTGEQQLADPLYGPLPQVIQDVQIGHIGHMDGTTAEDFYADLGFEVTPQKQLPWWVDEYPEWSLSVPYVPELPKLNQEDAKLAEAIVRKLTAGYNNLPTVNLVTDIKALKEQRPEIVEQMVAEGGQNILRGARGYMNHENPQDGIYILAPNIKRQVGLNNFEKGIAETLMHEMIGHYGVRGWFGNEAELRGYMLDLVDAFPKVAKSMSTRIGVRMDDHAGKQLVGEEMVAYLAGEVLSGKRMDLNAKQKNVLQRIWDWIKQWLVKHGWATPEDTDNQKGFWNDERVQNLIYRSQDFVRNGKGFEWSAFTGQRVRFMRDADIFQQGLVIAINTGTRTLPKSQRKQLANKKEYGGDVNRVPKEVPLFPEVGSPNVYREALIEAQKQGYISKKEMEYSGLDEKGDGYALLRDATYGDIQALMQSVNPDIGRDWYKEIMPVHIVAEIEKIHEAMDKAYMVGPIRGSEEDRPVLNQVTLDLARERIREILATKIDQKNTQLTKDILLAHAASDRALRVTARRQGGHRVPSRDEIGEILFGTAYDPDNISVMGADMITAEAERIAELGPDIGYNETAQRWFDYTSSHSYGEYTPQGSRFGGGDYRVVVIQQEGSHEMGTGRSAHWEHNLFHIRTGIAEALDFEGRPIIPDAPNPEMQNKFLTMIELQSDWLQDLRKAFTSGSDRDRAEEQAGRDRENLRGLGQTFVTNMSSDVWAAIDEQLKPIYNLPEGRLAAEYRAYAVEQYAMPWEEIPETSRTTAYMEFVNRQMNPVLEKLRAGMQILGDTRVGAVFEDIPGSMDARAFDALDTMAVGRIVSTLYDDFDALILRLQNAQGATTQQNFVDRVNEAKSVFMRRSMRAFERTDQMLSRLPYARDKIKEMLAPVFEATGIDPQIIDNRLGDMAQKETAHIRIPVARLKDYSKAALDEDSLVNHLKNMFSNGRLLNLDIMPNGLNRDFDLTVDNEYVEIGLYGTKEQLDQIHQKIEAIISGYVKEIGPNARANRLESGDRNRERERRREQERQNAARRQMQGAQEPTYSDIEAELDLDEIDTDDPSASERTTLSEYGIATFEAFEEEQLPDERDEIINEAFNNMDWEDVSNEDGESLHPSGEEFRSRVEFDDDGDADTDAAWEWLNEARNLYRQEMYEDDTYFDQAYERIRDRWMEDGPTVLITGSLPVAWDEDGDIDGDVVVRIEKTDHGETYDIYIDGEEYGNAYSLDDAKSALLEAIRDYYNDSDITPPAGSMFAPVDTRTEQMFPDTLEEVEIPEAEEGETIPEPNWDILANGIIDETSMVSGRPIKAEQIFERMVKLTKKLSEGRIVTDSPLADDRTWRPIALKYLLSDAVRRGFPGVVWNNGLASSKRGGNWGMGGTIKTGRVLWTQERMIIRGQTHNMIVVRSPDMVRPLVLDPSRLIPSLGRDLATHIMKQIDGTIPLSPEEQERAQDEQAGEEPRDRFLISTNEAGTVMALHRRDDGQFVGFARSEEEVNDLIEANDRPVEYLRVADPEVEAVGEEILKSGKVTSESLGGLMRIITGGQPHDYTHTFDIPRLAAARTSYEEVTHRAWEKELKKYGAEIKETYVHASDLRQAELKEGQPVKKIDNRDEQIRQSHGEVSVQELTGDTHGWIVMSEREGPLTDQVFANRGLAVQYLDDWKENNYGIPGGGVKVYYIEINDKIREEFSGPVAPFHYDPKNDPELKEAAEKIGYEDVTLREKLRAWKQAWQDNWQQGMFDRFYGIKRALDIAGEKREGYIETRLTTSLDSVMKAILEYGAPIWRNGMTETEAEGRGLLEILQPVMKQIDLWGMYMVGVRAKRLMAEGREQLFSEEEIDSMVALGEKYPQFKRVAADYAAFNKKVLDYAEQAGIVNPETRPLWENADYIPFYRVEDDRLVGPLSGGAGVANQRSPIKRLKGGEANIGNPIHNIMVNLTRLIDSSMKNHAALTTVDALKGSGIVSKKPMTFSQEMIPLQQVKKLLIDRGMNPDTIPQNALEGFQKMFAIQPPEGPGVISVMRDGKKEFYYTDDPLLYRAMTAINKKAWGRWMSIFRYPKRLLTTLVTLDPGFMAANYMRDSLSAFVLSRDNFVPVAAGIKGFGQALIKDKAMRTMLAAGAAFESGYINQYDPNSTQRLLKKAMKNKSFARTVMNTPAKLLEGWKAIGSATENANRLAVYNAAIAAGKSKKQAAYEAKDLMDFSMGGDWPVIQFLIQTVPFMGARMQGLHRLGRGFVENPLAFTMKGTLVMLAGMALWFAYRDDERYKELEEWDKDTYYHWWIGDNHYRLPKPFEVGAIFNTIPERIMEYMYSQENDAGQLLLRRMGHMFTETFNMNPIPQTVRPLVESYFNYNFFTGRSIVNPYEEARMAPEEYRYSTSPTMIELARAMPDALDTASGKIRSPLHLQNFYYQYTGTLGRYAMLAADAVVRDQMDYPNPPAWRTGDWPVMGRFFRGDEPRRTKFEEETYRLIRKVTEIQGSLRFLEKTDQIPRFEEIEAEWEPYIAIAEDLNDVRQEVSKINEAIMVYTLDEAMDPQEKRERIDELQIEKNQLFELGYSMRPGARPVEELTRADIEFMLNRWGEDTEVAERMEQTNPETFDLAVSIDTLGMRELERLAGAGGQE